MEENLTFSSPLPGFHVAGGYGWRRRAIAGVKAGADPSEERLRVEIEGHCSKRTQIPGVTGLDRQEIKRRKKLCI